MDRDTCRYWGCGNPTRDRGEKYGDENQYAVSGFGARFCSVEHELKYEHIRDDAREAKYDEMRDREAEL